MVSYVLTHFLQFSAHLLCYFPKHAAKSKINSSVFTYFKRYCYFNCSYLNTVHPCTLLFSI